MKFNYNNIEKYQVSETWFDKEAAMCEHTIENFLESNKVINRPYDNFMTLRYDIYKVIKEEIDFTLNLDDIYEQTISALKKHEAEVRTLVADYYKQIRAMQQAERARKADEEAFASRWFGCDRNHFSGRYMKYVDSIDKLKAGTWTEYDGKYIIKVVEDADYDYNYYAKSYGHPKKTVEDRLVCFYKRGTGKFAGVVVLAKQISIDNFRQGSILAAIAEYLKIEKPKRNKLQTNAYYDIKKAGNGLFVQRFGRQIVGYVAVDGDIAYHAYTKKEAIEGLERKIRLINAEAEKDAKTTYTADKLNARFGFCYQGMSEFCDAVGLDIEGRYSVKELKEAIKTHDCKDVMRKYAKELKAIKLVA